MSHEREHADAGPSSSKQWMLCPASVTLSRDKPRKSSVFAREGTCAHAVAELLIKGEPTPPEIEVEGEVIAVTDDMLDYVGPYVAFADMMEATADFFAIEQRVSLEGFYPANVMPEPVFGTADMISYHEATRKLTVADFKYGKGVKVDAKGNTQGRTYALGAINLLTSKGFHLLNEIEILIFQPRVSPDPSKETLSRVELITWFENELKPAIARIGAGDTTEVPGECQFCPRIGECRSVGRKAIEESRLAFDDGKVGVVAPEMSSLSNEEIGAILSKAEIIENWIKGLRAEASTRIDAGQTVPGWKLAPKRAQRKWKDEETAAQAFLKRGLTRLEVYETELRSPAGMEKVLKASGMTKEGIALVLKDLVVKESSGTTLVEDSDSRPSVSLKSIFDAAPAPALIVGGVSADDVL